MNPLDMLGAVMQSGMAPAADNRMGDVLGKMMGQMTGGAAAGAAPTAAGGGLYEVLSKAAGAMLGGGAAGAGGGAAAPGGTGGLSAEVLQQVAGAIFGGSGSQGNAAAGLGSMAVFGTLAAKALELAKGMFAGAPAQAGGPPAGGRDGLTAILTGLRAPANPQEQQQLMDVAMLTLKAMISAAKADGRVDEQEQARLLGKLDEGGITDEEQRFVAAEMQKPIDLDALVRGIPNQQVAAQIYTASLMTITVDSEAERRYLADLAAKLGLDQQVVSYLHQAVGLS
jgi:uncharacterized membrane protein YebE (DUF533 family)